MLRGLLKREIEIEPLDEPRRLNLCPKPRRKPRTKAWPIVRLYPASQPEPQDQAQALLDEIQTYVEDAIGQYVLQPDLNRFYGELCERRGWQRRHWCVIGRELGKVTTRVCKKRCSKRFMAYKIPRAHA